MITALHINERPTTHGDGMWWLSATATLTWLKSDPTAEADLAALDAESSGLAGLLNSITGGGAAAASEEGSETDRTGCLRAVLRIG